MSAAPGKAKRAVPAEDRQFSLVLALLATESGLTKAEILQTVRGYAQDHAAGVDPASLDRKFERDKESIRELGVPIETVSLIGDESDNHNLRYRIPKGAYDLPDDVRFTSDEVALLNLAARVWQEGSLSGESRRALTKLRALGISTDDPLIGFAPRIRLREESFEPLSQAIDKRIAVRFSYLKPGEERARQREVYPLALVQYEGRWHLSAVELASGADRTFLLRRIVGGVTPLSQQPPHERTGDHSAAAVAGLDAVWQANEAEILVHAGSDAASRLTHRRGTAEIGPDTLRVHYLDEAIFADELAGFGPEVQVLSPATLRDAVIARLKATVDAHG
ncbi:WYL domain-containing protein [Salinibacterium sp. ZJ77]|uniref:helix-turn-helix transcriptional regulator n=1 Tax=Salinibacterium sp. ZJ77 TaxID=2708337 RepID=UPI001FB8FE7C|nr:WYL domain-containing protein [Salinibacterium sp. ZJ77]